MEALCKVYMLIGENKLEASGTAEFVRECMVTFVGASVEANSVTVNVVNFPEFADTDVEDGDDVNQEAAPAADHEDKIGDTIAFFTDEDFSKNDENLACTAAFENVGYGDEEQELWCIRTNTNGLPAINEDTTGTEVVHFATRDEVIAYMLKFGFKPV